MSLSEDRNWAAKIYQERADAIDADQNVTYFFRWNPFTTPALSTRRPLYDLALLEQTASRKAGS